MKLSAEVKSDLKVLDLEHGGGLITPSTRTDIIDKPILIVGLGGTGAEALIRIKRAIKMQFNNGGAKNEKPPQVEYMAIDSDNNMRNLSYMDTRFSADEFLCLDTSNLTSIYRNRDTVFKNATHTWMADNLRLQQVKHGAGGIRQAGRLLLAINSNSVISMLTDKINRLTANRKANDLLYVFVTTGCAGGTGSGIFIDVPYIIKKIAGQKGFDTENIGMIFMPDVTLSDTTIDGSAAINIKVNGFAALKELDYLMNIERNGESFDQTFGELDIKTNEPPYDLCHLVSAKDESGKLTPNAKDYCMNVAAETIINFIASEDVTNGQSYTISSYLSNIENNRAAFIMTHQQKQPVNYIYNTVGASGAVLPVDYLLNYLTCKMFAELDTLKYNNPISDEAEAVLESMQLDMSTLERLLTQDKPSVRSFQQYDYSVLVQRPDILEDAVKKELIKLEEHYTRMADEIITNIQRLINEKNNPLFQEFINLETGPFYAQKMLLDTYEFSIPRVIDNIRKVAIPGRRTNGVAITAMELNRLTATGKLSKKAFLQSRKAQVANVIKLNEDYLRMVGTNIMYDAMDRIYSTALTCLNVFFDTTIDTHCELLNAFKELFDKFNQSPTTTHNFVWHIEDPLTMAEIFEKHNADTIDFKLSLKRLLQNMVDDFSWFPDHNNLIVDNLTRFTSEQFQDVIQKSLDYYCTLIAGEKGISLDEYLAEKIDTLQNGAKVMFPVNHIPSGLNISFPPYAYVSAPTNAPKVRNAISQIGSKVPNVKLSRMGNRLYMLNLKIAVALYCYKELSDYEAVYESSLGKIPGIHLYECETNNWKNLPSPNYDKLATKEYENPREITKNNRLREIFDEAYRLGIIRHDKRLSRLAGFFGDPVDLNATFENIICGIEDRTISASNARTAVSELSIFLASPEREKYRVSLFDTEYLQDTDTPDLEYAKGVFIYMPAFSEYVTREVELRKHVLKLQNKLTKIDLSEVKYAHFAQLLYMGQITKNRKNFICTIDGETQIMYTTQTLNEEYVEYDLFEAYLELDEKIASYLQKRAQEEENRLSDTQFKAVVKTIDGLIKSYKEKLSTLEESYMAERDGTLKKLFYQTMLNVFAREKKVLS